MTIVFDGNTEVFGGMTSPAVKIIFSQGESADDKIKKIVARVQNTKNIIVVSDDRDIQYAVRALGAKVSSVRAFLNQAKGPGKIPGKTKRVPENKNSSGSKENISKSDEHKITSEMGEIWLRPRNP